MFCYNIPLSNQQTERENNMSNKYASLQCAAGWFKQSKSMTDTVIKEFWTLEPSHIHGDTCTGALLYSDRFNPEFIQRVLDLKPENEADIKGL